MKKLIPSFLLFLFFFYGINKTYAQSTCAFSDDEAHVIFPNNPIYNFGTGPLTLEMTVIKSKAGRSDLFSRKENGNTDFGLFIDANLKIKFYLRLGGILEGNGGIVIESNQVLNLNQKYHIALTRNGLGNWSLYIDGILDNTGFSLGDLTLLQNAPFNLIGANHVGTPCCFYHQGEIDEFRIWNLERSQAQIATVGTGSVNPSSTGLLTYFKFNGIDCTCEGALIPDLAGTNNANYAAVCLPTCTEPSIPTPEELKNGLVSLWSFDENTVDTEGVNNGTVVGTGFSYTTAKYGKGIDLDGGNTYINAGNDASLNMTGQSLTISAWFRVDDFTIFWQALIAKGESNNFRIHRFSNTNNLAYNGGSPDIQAVQNINDGNFHHVVVVTENGVRKSIYIDGVLAGTSSSGTTITDTGNDLWIGNNPDIPSRDWNGVIDDVAIWNRALDPCQVTYLYESGMPVNTLISPAIKEIPALSSWGLMIFGLLVLNLGIGFLYRFVRTYS